MRNAWTWFLCAVTTLGGLIGTFVGGTDGFFTVLLTFVIMDYISGLMKSAYKRELSSSVGFRGIFKKLSIFIMVGIANLIDSSLIGYNGILRTAIIFFYVANEGISILENLAAMDVVIPRKLKEVLLQLRKKGEENGNDEADEKDGGNDDEKSDKESSD